MILAQVCCVVCEVKSLHGDVGWLALPAKVLSWVIGIGETVVECAWHGWKRILRIWGPRPSEARKRRGSIEAIVRIHSQCGR